MEDNALRYLALSRKAGRAELGEEPAGAAARAKKAALVIVASDASEHTWRRAQSFVAGTAQQCLRVPYTKDEMGRAVGRQELAIAAVTDAPLALALCEALTPVPEAAEELRAQVARLRQRQKEAKAHRRNRRLGKRRRTDGKQEH